MILYLELKEFMAGNTYYSDYEMVVYGQKKRTYIMFSSLRAIRVRNDRLLYGNVNIGSETGGD